MSNKSHSQLLSQLTQRKKFTDFQWGVVTDEGANQKHKATFYYQRTPIYTSLHWYAKLADAKNETASYVLPVLTQALSGPIPVSSAFITSLPSYISTTDYILRHNCEYCTLQN